MEEDTNRSGSVKAASTIALLAGIWLFISPWVYAASRMPHAWNSWVVGFFIALFAAIRIGNAAEDAGWLSWLTCLLGGWTFVSPWVYRYTMDTSQFVNSLCVGVIVFVLSIIAMRGTTHRTGPHTGTPLRTGM